MRYNISLSVTGIKRAFLLIVILLVAPCGLLACHQDSLKQRIAYARFIEAVDFGKLGTGADSVVERELTIREVLIWQA